MRRAGRPVLVALAAGLLLSGCAKTIDRGQIEKQIADSVQAQLGQRPTVDCPSGAKAHKGDVFDCKAKTGDAAGVYVVRMLDDRHFTFTARDK